MGKTDDLAGLSLEELWTLFPIFLTEHNPEWSAWFEEEKSRLEHFLPMDRIRRIDHIGSTSIETIWAKPIVDILVEMKPEADTPLKQEAAPFCREIKILLEQNGYICMSEDGDRLSFNKGYTPAGFAERVFHLHLRKDGDHDELYFRDYMCGHPDAAKEYEELKLRLWKQYVQDRDAYTQGKTELVTIYTETARKIYAGRYE